MGEYKNPANNKRNKRIRNLIIICVMSALLLTVGTYAWFIGMQTVKVNSFEVKIASVDSLSLSLDGYTWSTQLDDVVTDGAGKGTNEFLTDDKEGLKPISTIGVFDKTVS
jgi:flagellar basal body-associated protein FliL